MQMKINNDVFRKNLMGCKINKYTPILFFYLCFSYSQYLKLTVYAAKNIVIHTTVRFYGIHVYLASKKDLYHY